MAYIKIEDNEPWTEEVYELLDYLSPDEVDIACWLHTAAQCFCNKNQTDGRINKQVIPTLIRSKKAKKIAETLTKVGWWREENKYFFIKNYAEKQTTSAEIEKKKELKKQRNDRYYRKKQGSQDVATDTFKARLNAASTTNLRRVNKEVRSKNKEDKEKINKKEKSLKQKPQAVIDLCDHLADHIALSTDRRPSIGEGWLVEMDRLIRLDGRDPELILQVIDWCQADEFWRGNILSSKKLREKFDQLLVRMRSAGSQQTASSSTGGPSWQRGMLSHGRMTAEQEQHLYERDREKLEEVAATATEEEIRSLLDPAAPQNVVSLHPVEGRKEEVGR